MKDSQIALLDKPAGILLIDNSQDDRKLIRQALSLSLDNFAITFSESAQLGLDLLKSNDGPDKFDLVILDIEMLILDDYHFLKDLRGDDSTANIPVVVMTNSNTHNQLDKAYECGANILIQKKKFLELAPEVVQILVDYWYRLAHVPNR